MIQVGTRVFVSTGPLHGVRGIVEDIFEEDDARTYTVTLEESWGAYSAGDQVDFHPFEIKECR